MSDPKADCPDFKPSPQAAWMCYWWMVRQSSSAWYCGLPEDADLLQRCPTAGLRNKPRGNYQPEENDYPE